MSSRQRNTPLTHLKNGARGALRSGRSVLRAFSRATLQQQYVPVVILAYHRVTDIPGDPFVDLAVSPRRFREQMAFLASHIPVLRFEDDWRAVRKPSVVVTFDDGYADNYLEALPILEEFGIPATFFVASGYLDAPREFWWDELARLIHSTRAVPRSFAFKDRRRGGPWITESRDERWALFFDLHRLAKRSDPHERAALLGAVKEWSGASTACRASHRPLSSAQLKALAASPLATIGGHTVTHPSLGFQSKERQQVEIAGSLGALAESIGKKVEVFSYPFGGSRDFGPETIAILKECGVKKSAVCMSGLQFPWTDPFRLPRQMINDWDACTFAGRLAEYIQVPAAARDGKLVG